MTLLNTSSIDWWEVSPIELYDAFLYTVYWDCPVYNIHESIHFGKLRLHVVLSQGSYKGKAGFFPASYALVCLAKCFRFKHMLYSICFLVLFSIHWIFLENSSALMYFSENWRRRCHRQMLVRLCGRGRRRVVYIRRTGKSQTKKPRLR